MAETSTLQNVIGGVRIIILIACFIMACVGTARPQFELEDTKYKFNGIHAQGWKISYKDIGCSSFQNRMRAGHAFAVMTCIFLGFAIICSIVFVLSLFIAALKRFTNVLRIVSIVLSVISWIFVVVAWACAASCLHQKFCNSRSLSKQGYEIADGMGLLIGCWLLLFIDLAICIAMLVYTLKQGGGGSK